MGDSRIWIILLAVPVCVFLASSAVLWSIDQDWYESLEDEFGPLTTQQRESVSLEAICDDPIASQDVGEWCTHVEHATLIQNGSIATGVASGVLVLLIGAAGRIGLQNRFLLLLLFRPGLVLTMLAVTCLVAVNAALTIGASYYLLAEFLGIAVPAIFIVVGLGGLLGIVVLIETSLDIVKRAKTYVIGREIEPDDSPDLWQFVKNVAEKTGARPPRSIVAGLEPNFFVTEADVQIPGATLNGETMYLSLPLCRILSQDEFRSVIAHELAHFQGQDTKFSRGFYPIYRGAAQSLGSLTSCVGGGLRMIPILPAIAVLSHFLESFMLAERAISRDREFAADHLATEITSKRTLASTMVKIHSFGPLWDSAIRYAIMFTTREEPNSSHVFVRLVNEPESSSFIDTAATKTVTHPTDSHPSLGERLLSLGLKVEDVATEARKTNPPVSAIDLFNDPEEIEVDLTLAVARVARQSGARQ